MSWVAVGVTAASVVVSYQGGQEGKKAAGKEAEFQRLAGQKRKEAADFEANVLEVQATQKIAAAQRDMLDVQRITRLAESRAQALSAASGGGATSPTALNIIGNLSREGAYNAARALYSGEETARTMRLQAFEKRQEGEFAEIGGNMQAEAAQGRGKAAELQSYANILGSVGGLYGKYGGRGPGSSGGGSSGGMNWDTTGDFGGSSYG